MTIEEIRKQIGGRLGNYLNEVHSNGLARKAIGNNLRIGPCRNGTTGFYFFSGIEINQRYRLYGLWLKKRIDELFNACGDFVTVDLSNNPAQRNESRTVEVTFRATESEQAPQRLEKSLEALRLFLDDLHNRTNWDEINTAIEAYNRGHQEMLDEYCQRFQQQTSPVPSPSTSQPQQEDSQMIGEIQSLLVANFNVILTGAPGTGKTYKAREVAKKMVGAAVAADATADDKENAKKIEEERIASVQFHPGYDYSDFVIGMKPVLVSEDGKEVFTDKDGRLYTMDNGKKDGKPQDFSGKADVSFQWKDGIFKEFSDKAKGNPDHNYVFLIDEINRADLSRVFGELFSMLEEEYRYCKEDGGTERNAKGVTLPNGTNFVIPENLYIIGTMNDIDRSVESMDFALRRRFAWYEVSAESSKHIIGDKVSDKNAVQKLESAMTSLNDCISGKKSLKVDDETIDFGGILGSAFELGGAIFAKYEKYNGKDDAYKRLWDNHIKNILSEYLRGRPGRDEKLLPALRKIFDAAVNDASKKEEDP